MEFITYRVPLLFGARVIEKRCRNVERTWQYKWVDVPVCQGEADEFPRAASWAGADGRSHAVRWDGERHLRPVEVVDGDGRLCFLESSIFKASAAGGNYPCPLFRFKDGSPSGVMANVAEFDPGRFRDVVEDGSDEAYQDMLARARKLVIIDGVVWERCQEPVYICSRMEAFRSIRLGCTPVMVGYLGERETGDPKCLFRLDRGDDYLAALEGVTGVRIDPRDLAEIHMPEAFRYNDEEVTFLTVLEELCERARGGIGRRPHAEIRAWADLDEAVAASGGSVNETIHEAAERYAGIIEDSYWKDKVTMALHRWSSRPIEVELPRIGY